MSTAKTTFVITALGVARRACGAVALASLNFIASVHFGAA